MSALATEWGGVPRTLLRFYKISRSDIEEEVHDAASEAAMSSPTLLPSLQKLDVKGLGPSLIFFILPRKDDAGHINRRLLPRVCVPTPTLVNALGKALQRQNLYTKVAFLQVMEAHPGTRRDGGNIYERWLHPFFLGGQSIKSSLACRVEFTTCYHRDYEDCASLYQRRTQEYTTSILLDRTYGYFSWHRQCACH
ncbi:hypothetical protein J3R83DRAFT_13424 [Lanmaoa asiatica]|nr:hypothetical protein J3R83DRAFT_13424 [Lanmaoa asiatica]